MAVHSLVECVMDGLALAKNLKRRNNKRKREGAVAARIPPKNRKEVATEWNEKAVAFTKACSGV